MNEILLLILGCAALIFGGELLVRGSVGLALKAKISPMVIGLTVVSLGTSAPELFASVRAALMGNPDISIGNVIGSNIANFGLVLGITALIFPLPIDRSVLKKELPLLIIVSLSFLFLSIDGGLGLWDGILLIVGIITFMVFLIVKSIKNHETPDDDDDELAQKARHGFWTLTGLIVLGSLGLYFGSEWFVKGAIVIASKFGVSDHVIGVTLVAFGTSLPELTASGIAAFRKQTDISLGNLIGSNVFNILGVLGATAIVKPLDISSHMLHHDFIWMLGVTLLLFPIIYFGKKISRFNGLTLLICYFTYITLLFWK